MQKLAADTTLVGLIGSACSDEAVGGIKPEGPYGPAFRLGRDPAHLRRTAE